MGNGQILPELSGELVQIVEFDGHLVIRKNQFQLSRLNLADQLQSALALDHLLFGLWGVDVAQNREFVPIVGRWQAVVAFDFLLAVR